MKNTENDDTFDIIVSALTTIADQLKIQTNIVMAMLDIQKQQFEINRCSEKRQIELHAMAMESGKAILEREKLQLEHDKLWKDNINFQFGKFGKVRKAGDTTGDNMDMKGDVNG